MSYCDTCQVTVTPWQPVEEKTFDLGTGKDKHLRTQIAQNRTFTYTRKDKMDFRMEGIQTDLEDEVNFPQKGREELHSTRTEQHREINTRLM